MNYGKPLAILAIFGISAGSIYALTYKTPEERIREAIISQNKAIEEANQAKVESYRSIKDKCEQTASGSSEQILAKLSECSKMEKPTLQKQIQLPSGSGGSIEGVSKNKDNVEKSTATVSDKAVAPSSGSTKIINNYLKEPTESTCADFPMKKVKTVVIHNTATDSNVSAKAIENGHVNRWKLTTYTSAYHYLIEADGDIYRPRSETCGSLALSEKATVSNQESINISYIGSSKPTEKQLEQLVKLTRDIQNRYGLSRDSVTAHADIQAKNKAESMEGMFGSKDTFVKMLREKDTISIYGKESPELTYMWKAWGDKDFIGTIFQESRMNNNTVGDGGQSIGYCQIHKGYQPGWYNEYKKLTTMEERLNYCHEKYSYVKSLKGGVGSRFYGWNKKDDHIKNITIS